MILARSIFSAFAVIVVAVADAGAATTMYSNTTTFSGLAYANGGATTVSGNTSTSLIADDITAGAGLGGLPVNSVTFSVANFNTSTTSFNPVIAFYQGDGAGGGPGTLIASYDTGTVALGSGQTLLLSYGNASPSGLFTMPTGLFWAGVYFTNNSGQTGATAAALNNIGQGIFGPPTIGSSFDVFFGSTGAAPSGNNPAGNLLFFGGNPTANFGWSFTSNASVVTAAVPLPTAAVMGLSLLAGAALARPRK